MPGSGGGGLRADACLRSGGASPPRRPNDVGRGSTQSGGAGQHSLLEGDSSLGQVLGAGRCGLESNVTHLARHLGISYGRGQA